MARRFPAYHSEEELPESTEPFPGASAASSSPAAPAALQPQVGAAQPRRGYKFFDRIRRKQADGAGTPKPDGEGEAPQVVPSAHAFLNAAVEVNDETIEAIQRSERLAQEAEEMGQYTSQKAAKNREQIEHVHRTMDDFEPMTKRAKKEITTMVRRMFRDKCFMTLFCIVLGMVIAVIVVAIVRDDDPLGRSNDNKSNGTETALITPVGPTTAPTP